MEEKKPEGSPEPYVEEESNPPSSSSKKQKDWKYLGGDSYLHIPTSEVYSGGVLIEMILNDT